MIFTPGRRIVTATLVAALTFTGVATASAADVSPSSWLNLPAPQQVGPGGPPSGTPGGPPSQPPGPPTTADGTPTPSATADTESTPASGPGNRPEGAGLPSGVGAAGFERAPELPRQASDQARAAVTMAFERQALIADMIAQIRDIPPGPEKGAAVSEVVREFADIFRLMSEAIEAEDDADVADADVAGDDEEADTEDTEDTEDE
ncbi:MAG: hypothetical protein AMXMBFR23_02240 [Chloroflexota bacterium]